jgi:hypothetical protein
LAHTGGVLKATAETFFVTASGGGGISLDLVNKTYGGAILSGIEVTALNPQGVASPAVDLDLSTDSGAHWSTVATGLALDHFGQGSYLWTAGPETTGNTALFRVRARDGSQPSDVSDAPFLIANSGQDFFVNDGSTAGDVFMTAIGDNTNSGKSPDRPMASIAALVAAYDLAPGDVIHVDTGIYHLVKNIVLTAGDSGVRIEGPAASAPILDRGNQSSGSYVIDLQHASDVTLTRLAVTGGYIGIFAASGADSDRLTADSNEIYGNFAGGISLEFSNDDAVISNNRIHDQVVFFAPGIYSAGARAHITSNIVRSTSDQTALLLTGPQIIATGNDVSGANVGIDVGVGGGPENQIVVQNNTVHDNRRVGIQGGDNVLIAGNVIFGQLLDGSATGISVFGSALTIGNDVFNNKYGITTSSKATGNRVYHNSVTGILTGLSGVADGNYVYSNAIGIQAGIGGYYNSAQISNNLVYANANQGILIGRTYAASGVTVVNNTVYQPVGDAILLDGDTSNLVLRNNVLWIDAGYAIHATTSNHPGLSSDYNLFQQVAGPGALLGFWAGADRATLLDWHAATGQDAHSLYADAGFVDINGADNVLGYDVSGNGYDGGPDDNFYARKSSNTIDRGDAAFASNADIEGQPRVDDPGSPNLGPVGSLVDLGAYEFRGSSLDATPPTVIATSPAGIQAGSGTVSFGQLILSFSEGVNPIDARAAASYELRSAGPDGVFDDGDDAVYGLTPQYTASAVVTINVAVAGGLLPLGKYRFTAFSNSSTSIHDLAGLALDGNADGAERGNYVRVFSVVVPNRAPSFVKGSDQTTTDDAGLRTVVAWGTAISPGPPNEAAQALTFIITTDNDSLFEARPAIDALGALTFTPAPNAYGIVHVTVVLQDDGGTAAGGVNVSPPQTFTITVTKLHVWYNAKVWSNGLSGLDVNDDNHVAANDALAVINYINGISKFLNGQVPALGTALPNNGGTVAYGGPFGYLDVNGDGFVAANDALAIINVINAHQGGEGGPSDTDSDLMTLLAIDVASQPRRRR